MKKQTGNTEDKELYLVLLIAAGISMLPLLKIGRKENGGRKDHSRKDHSRKDSDRKDSDRKDSDRKDNTRKDNSRKSSGGKDNSRKGPSRNVADKRVQNRKAPNRKVLNEKVQNKEARVSVALSEETWKKESQNEEILFRQAQEEEIRIEEEQIEEPWTEEAHAEEAWVEEAHAEETWTEEVHAEEAWTEETHAEEPWTEEAHVEEPLVEEAHAEVAWTEEAHAEAAWTEEVHAEDAWTEIAHAEETCIGEAQSEETLAQKAQLEGAWAGEVQVEEAWTDEAQAEEKQTEEMRGDEALSEGEQSEEIQDEEDRNEEVLDEDWDKEAWDKEIQDEEDWDKEAWDKEIQDEEDWDKEAWDKEICDEEVWNGEVQNEIAQKEEYQTEEDQNKKDQDRISEPEPLTKTSERSCPKWVKRIACCFYLIIVLGICMLPLLAMGVKGQQNETENRTMTSPPELFDEEEGLQWDYLSKIGDYFDEHFAFRSELVSLDAWVRTTVFGVSPVSEVIVGENGWLYYTATLDDFQHKNPASDRMLFNIAHNISLMQRYTESLGMDFLFTVAPNKNSLYTENMPLRLMYQVEEQSDMDRLLFWLDKERVNYVDLFSLFGEQEEVLYYQKDSHWNRKGAVMVYNALLDACGKEHETYENSQTQIVNDYYGDLNRMLFPIGGEPEQEIYYMGGNEWMYRKGETVEDSLIITESAEGSQTLLMYRDSFGNSLLPLLAGEYSQAVFSKRVPYTMTDLAIYWPDVVIVEKVERHLPTLAEVPPLMSAPVIMLDGEQISVESNTTLELTKEGSYWNFFGTADVEYMSTNSRIFVEITDADGTRVYEAFCVSYSDDGLSDNGFTLYISEIALSGDLLNVKVMTQRDSEIIVLMEDEVSLMNR